MLGAAHRMRDGRQFSHAVRRGRKAARRTLVLHAIEGTGGETSVGFVVSKAVGNAVVRNRVKRQLRHGMRERLDLIVSGTDIVVRALPAAAEADFDSLGRDLDRALERCGVSITASTTP